jgi:hypothetical protein
MTRPTTTSEEILIYLKDKGFKISPADRDFIRGKIYKAITEAYEHKSNGCDCGQMGCPICTP